jgi:hypothetical protein
MKKKKVLLKNELSEIVFNDKKVIISKFTDKWFFEIGRDSTYDIAEAVSILIGKIDSSDSVWETKIEDITLCEITPEKSLFWLTGGFDEWERMENYKKPWHMCYLDFQEEFGEIIIEIVKNSETLGQIRDGFVSNMNLPILYDFAISRDLV